MKLAVKREMGSVPGSGYHYMLHPISVDREWELFELMGYIVFDVDDEKGTRLLKSAGAAIRFQVEVAVLAERALSDKSAKKES